MAILFGSAKTNYPGRRIFANNLPMSNDDFIVTADIANNPTLILAKIYGADFMTYCDVFFAVNHITDPYTQLPAGKALHIVQKLEASNIAVNTVNVTKSKHTIKVKHLKTNKNKITF